MKITYYATVKMQRTFPLEAAAIKMIYNILSIPKMALEVFSRQSFGERYFSMPLSILTIIALAILPITFPTTDQYPFRLMQMIGANISWYIYLAGFTTMAVLRQIEINREPSVFDFAKHSLSDGQHQRWFQNLVLNRLGKLTPRVIDIWVEPGFYFLLGLVIYFMIAPFIGLWILFCALCFMLANHISYREGDHMIMDWIDRLIEAQQFERFFVDNRPTSETKGFKINGRRPTKKKLNEALSKIAMASQGDMKDKDGRTIDWEWLKKNAFDEDGNPHLHYFTKR